MFVSWQSGIVVQAEQRHYSTILGVFRSLVQTVILNKDKALGTMHRQY